MKNKREWEKEPATEKQYSYALRLLNSRLDASSDTYRVTAECLMEKRTPSGQAPNKKWMHLLIDKLKALPELPPIKVPQTPPTEAKAKAPAKQKAIAEGLYTSSFNGKHTIYKVQRSQYGLSSGRLYAKELMLVWSGTKIPLTEDELALLSDAEVAADYKKGGKHEGDVIARFVKIKNGPKMLQAHESTLSLTKEEASAYGQLYGICAVCGRILTDETSIAEGIGPVCRSKF